MLPEYTQVGFPTKDGGQPVVFNEITDENIKKCTLSCGFPSIGNPENMKDTVMLIYYDAHICIIDGDAFRISNS